MKKSTQKRCGTVGLECCSANGGGLRTGRANVFASQEAMWHPSHSRYKAHVSDMPLPMLLQKKTEGSGERDMSSGVNGAALPPPGTKGPCCYLPGMPAPSAGRTPLLYRTPAACIAKRGQRSWSRHAQTNTHTTTNNACKIISLLAER